jgi:hypothetical protein
VDVPPLTVRMAWPRTPTHPATPAFLRHLLAIPATPRQGHEPCSGFVDAGPAHDLYMT